MSTFPEFSVAFVNLSYEAFNKYMMIKKNQLTAYYSQKTVTENSKK